jgi:methyl-accepting chemotaxis protein
MPDTDATMSTADQVAAAAEQATSMLLQTLRRTWLAGLGLVAIAGERAQTTLETLEKKGQEFEPSVAAPFKRASEAASRVMDRAGKVMDRASESVKQAGSTVSGAVPLTGASRRVTEADLKEHVDRAIDEKFAVILKRLDALEEKIKG